MKWGKKPLSLVQRNTLERDRTIGLGLEIYCMSTFSKISFFSLNIRVIAVPMRLQADEWKSRELSGTKVPWASSFVTWQPPTHTALHFLSARLSVGLVMPAWAELRHLGGMLSSEKVHGKLGGILFPFRNHKLESFFFFWLFSVFLQVHAYCFIKELRTVIVLYLKYCGTRKSILFGENDIPIHCCC